MTKLTKFIISTITASLTIYAGKMAIPIIVLLCFMVLDYITGITVAWIRHELSSRIGIIGIIKKVFYLVTIAVGTGADWIIFHGLRSINIQIESGFAISMIITIWLIINELISIMENVAKINGDSLPKFIMPLLDRLKSKVEEKAETEGKQ